MTNQLLTHDEWMTALDQEDDAIRFQWLLDNATLTTTMRQGVKYWSLEVRGDYPDDAGMGDVRDMVDVSRGA